MLLNRLFVGLAAQALFQRVAGTRSAPIARAPLSTSALVKLAKNTNQPAVKAKATSKTTRQSSTATTKKSKADVTAGATAKAEKAKNLAEKKEKAKQKKLQQELAKKEKKEKEKAKALALKEKEKALALKEKEKALAQKQKEKARKEKEKAKELAKKEKASKAKTPKDKPWELRDADGKLGTLYYFESNAVPLPMATKPKRKTSFLLYFAERFTQLKHLDEYLKTSPSTGKQIPDLTAMSTSVAKEWKELPDAQRAEFEKKVAEQKAQYEKDLEAWRESLTPEDIRRQNLYYSHQRKTGKAAPSNLRDPNMPKRPLGAFFSFVQEQREAKTLSGSVIEQSRQAADMWKSMSAEKRQAYEKASTQQIEEYMQAMEEYKARNQIA